METARGKRARRLGLIPPRRDDFLHPWPTAQQHRHLAPPRILGVQTPRLLCRWQGGEREEVSCTAAMLEKNTRLGESSSFLHPSPSFTHPCSFIQYFLKISSCARHCSQKRWQSGGPYICPQEARHTHLLMCERNAVERWPRYG